MNTQIYQTRHLGIIFWSMNSTTGVTKLFFKLTDRQVRAGNLFCSKQYNECSRNKREPTFSFIKIQINAYKQTNNIIPHFEKWRMTESYAEQSKLNTFSNLFHTPMLRISVKRSFVKYQKYHLRKHLVQILWTDKTIHDINKGVQ